MHPLHCRIPSIVLALGLLLHATAARAQAAVAIPPSTTAADAVLIDEAKAFMDGYAADLLAGNRAAVAGRYDRTGVYEIRPAEKHFTPHAEIAARYANDWEKPVTFEWRDLSYEVLAPDKVMVTGLFAWGTSAISPPDVLSYAAVLGRQDGDLRIRMEAEAWGDMPPPWGLIAAAAILLVVLTLLLSWLVRKLIARRRLRSA